MAEFVKVLGRDYRVERGPAPLGDSDHGRSEYFNQRIWINPDMSEQEQESTLVHEVLHCISYMLYLELPEEHVMRLEVALYDLGFRVKTTKGKK